jgi:hypothetical protein
VLRRSSCLVWHGQAKRRHVERRHAGARLRRALAWHPTVAC